MGTRGCASGARHPRHQSGGGAGDPCGDNCTAADRTAAQSGTLQAWEGDTDIFIYPGFRFRVADGLMTNFHLPQIHLDDAGFGTDGAGRYTKHLRPCHREEIPFLFIR